MTSETIYEGTDYYVCDYCAHVHTISGHNAPAKCEHCRKPLDGRVSFDYLEAAERYSQAVLDYNRE